MSQQINLYQAKFRKQRKRLSSRDAMLAMLLIAVSVVIYSAALWQKNEQLAKDSVRIEHEVAAQKAVADKLSAEINQRKKDVQLEGAAQRAEQQVAATREVMQFINGGSLGSPNGYSEQLRALARQALTGLWLTGFTLAADAEENLIRGRTLDAELVPAYLRRLNQESTLQGQHFDSLTISSPAAAASQTAQAAETKPAPATGYLEFSVGAAKAAMPQSTEPKPVMLLANPGARQ